MEEIMAAMGLMKTFVFEKNPDNNWVQILTKQLQEVKVACRDLENLMKQSKGDSDLKNMQKTILQQIMKLECSLGKSHIIDAQVDQTVEVLSSLIEKRLNEIKDGAYKSQDDLIFEQEEYDRFFEVVKTKQEKSFELWQKLGLFNYGPRPNELKDGSATPKARYVEYDGGKFYYYGQIKSDSGKGSQSIKHGKGILLNLERGYITEGWFKDDQAWGYHRKIYDNHEYVIGYY